MAPADPPVPPLCPMCEAWKREASEANQKLAEAHRDLEHPPVPAALDAWLRERADIYAARVVTPLYRHGEAPTPYEFGMLATVRLAFRAGAEAALRAAGNLKNHGRP